MKTVMAFGTFDFLHPGHVFYLKKAKKLGDRLVVVVARDRNVRLIKGKKPLNGEKDRLLVVKQLRFVDRAVLGDRLLRKLAIVKRFHPTTIALGYDQWPSIPSLREELEQAGLNPRIVRIKSFKPRKNSGSRLRKH
jgi:FAD synthetase